MEKVATKKAIVVIRCSSKPQFEKYGPSSQLRDVNESLLSCPFGRVELYRTIQVQESASGWNRKRWEAAMDACLKEYEEGKAQVIAFPRVDRESRFLAGSFPKLLEVIKSGMLVWFALERLWLDPNNPDSFEQYQREVLDAQAYIRVLRRNITKGKRDCAEEGKIPSGFGRCNYWGLRYDKKRKRFEHILGVIHIPKEILTRCIAGKSSSIITVDLQKRGVLSATGGKIHRSAVSRVLSHARVYAGILTWNGYTILGKVEPIITEEEANIVAERLRKNQEKSYGFGKRKPLTGRIFCGLCGRRYSLEASKGCRCNGADPRNPVKCHAPKVGLKLLTDYVYEALGRVIMDDEALITRTAELREQWERETAGIEEKLREKEAQLATFNRRRRLLSIQHELGGITDDEYTSRLKAIKREEAEFTEQLAQLSRFTPAEEPPKPEDVREALLSVSSDYWVLCQLGKAMPLIMAALAKDEEREKQIQQLVEKLDIKVIVYPGDGKQQFKLDVLANIPIQKQEVREGVMVSPSL